MTRRRDPQVLNEQACEAFDPAEGLIHGGFGAIEGSEGTRCPMGRVAEGGSKTERTLVEDRDGDLKELARNQKQGVKRREVVTQTSDDGFEAFLWQRREV